MKQSHTGIIMLIVTAILIITITTNNPFHYSEEKSGTITTPIRTISIIEGTITKGHIIVTNNMKTIYTNGVIIEATASNTAAEYTIYVYNNNSITSTSFTRTMKPLPKDFIITYNSPRLTYQGISYYTNTIPPITFMQSTVFTYNTTFIVDISFAIVNWNKTKI